MATDIEIESLLIAALESEHGICIQCTDPDQLKKRLYIVRESARKSGIGNYDVLSFRTSPTQPQMEVWITKQKEKPNERTAQEGTGHNQTV